jgi:hypothetical protein
MTWRDKVANFPFDKIANFPFRRATLKDPALCP